MALLTAQFLVYGTAWLISALFIREARQASVLWAAYSFLQAVGIQVMVAEQPAAPRVTVAAAAVMLLAYTCAVAGLDAFVNGRRRYDGLWATLLGLSWAWLLLVRELQLPHVALGAGYDLSIVALLLAPMLVLRRPFLAEFGLVGRLATIPGLLMVVFVLIRLAVVLQHPQPAGQSAATGYTDRVLVPVLVIVGAFNLSLLGLIVGRLVLRLHGLVDTDPMTRLANRAALQRHLAAQWQSARRNAQALSVAFIDIDHFKAINDSGGHAQGDQVLLALAEVLRRHARLSDVVGRWGGDEFIVVMPQTAADGAQEATRRLAQAVQASGIATAPGCPPLSLSIGLATLRDDDVDVQSLIDRADADMYLVKRRRGPAPG